MNHVMRKALSLTEFLAWEEAMVFARRGEEWLAEVIGSEGALALPEIGITLPLTELYADVDLSPPPTREAETV